VRERAVPLFFIVLLLVTAVLVAAVVLPVLKELLLAVVLASVLRPAHRWLTTRLRGRSGLSAGLITFGVILIVIGPLAMLVAVVVRDGADGVQFLLDTVHGPQIKDMVSWLPESARDTVLDTLAGLPKTFQEVMGEVGENSRSAAPALKGGVVATGSFLFHGTLMMIALFFLLTGGDEIITWLDEVSPLQRGQTRELITIAKKVSYSIVVASIATSAVQAAAALVGFYIARVPSPIFFASVTFIAAFIPAIGAAAVCLVAALLLYATGHPYMAIFLAIWGVIVVGLVDNVIKPLLIRRGMEIHGGVVFFALLGGIATFGAIGLIIGPLVVSMFLALIAMYHRDYSPHKTSKPEIPGVSTEPTEPPTPDSPPRAPEATPSDERE
jgi:predicted PurR-regulated permease PerM